MVFEIQLLKSDKIVIGNNLKQNEIYAFSYIFQKCLKKLGYLHQLYVVPKNEFKTIQD